MTEVVRPANQRGGEQSRAQIGKSERPARRRLARGQQQMTLALGQQVEEMQQRLFIGGVGIVDGGGFVRTQQLRHPCRGEFARIDPHRRRARAPHFDEMCLAAAGRPR